MRRGLFLLALAVCLNLSRLAAAQEKSAADLKKSGNEKMDASDFVGALEDYQAALKLDPNDPTLHFNIGRAHGLLGHNVEALAELEKFGQTATPELKARAQFDLLYSQTKAKVAYLTVTCGVRGARVVLGQKVLGTTPLTRVAVGAEPLARVTIDADGYLADAQSVQLSGGREAQLQCHLLPKSTAGTLVVGTKPTGALIDVDGKAEGNTPAELKLPAGPHTVVARLEGYDDLEVRVMVDAGDQKKTVDLPLAKSVPITARWWFWTGIAVVVVGGVVLTAALLTERSPDKGTIQPGQIPAPLVTF
jgi:hypothetical protein